VIVDSDDDKNAVVVAAIDRTHTNNVTHHISANITVSDHHSENY